MSRTVPTFAERHAAVESVSRLARWAVGVGLVSAGLVALTYAKATGPVPWRDGAGGPLALTVMGADSVARLAAMVLFLTWVYRAVANARALGVPLRWGPIQAVLAHVVPMVNWVLPYYVMKALYRASDPSTLNDAPIFRERAEANYREGARELLAPPRWRLPAPILAWCILYDVTTLSALLIYPLGASASRYVGASCGMATGVLCALIVRSIDARQRELCRRLEAGEGAGVAD
jgi:Domain of unknown function (DUF4328)